MITRTSYKMTIEDEVYRVTYMVREYRLLGIRLLKTQDEIGRRGAEIPKDLREVVRRLDDAECVYCGEPEEQFDTVTRPAFHVDHIIPQVQGGPTHIWNLAYSCRDCNLKKNGKTPTEAHMPLRCGRYHVMSLDKHIPYPPDMFQHTWESMHGYSYQQYLERFDHGDSFLDDLRAAGYRIPYVTYSPPLYPPTPIDLLGPEVKENALQPESAVVAV